MKYKLEPWGHQIEAIQKASPLDWYAFFFEPGAGKTGTTINTLRHKINTAGRNLRQIILGPRAIVTNWKDEWLKHSFIDPGQVIPLRGSGKKRLETFLKHAYAKDPTTGEIKPVPRTFITNYEGLLMKGLYEAFTQWAPEAVVCDESHLVKSHEALRSQLAEALCNPWDKRLRKPKKKPYVYLLSGTPILNDATDLFMQFKIMLGGFPTDGFFELYVVDPDLAIKTHLITNFYAFRGKYCVDANAHLKGIKVLNEETGIEEDIYFPKWVFKPESEVEINRLVQSCAMYVKKEDCMDLPGEVFQFVKVDMSPEQRKAYNEIKKQFVTMIEGKYAKADLAMTKYIRLLQITSGFLPLHDLEDANENDPVKHSFKDTPKQEALEDLLQVLTPTTKVTVWCVWRENYEQVRKICEKLGLKYVEMHGDVSDKKKDEAKDSFNNDSDVRVFIGHPRSGGIGINLIGKPGTTDRCTANIHYSRTAALEFWDQSRARNYRGGQTEKVTNYVLVCENTNDELTAQAVIDKQKLAQIILEIPLDKI